MEVWLSPVLSLKDNRVFPSPGTVPPPAPNKTGSENLRVLRAPNQGLQDTIRFVYSSINILISVTWNGKKTIKGASIGHHGPFLFLAVLLLAILLLNKSLNLHFISLAKGLQETIAVLAWIQTNWRIKVLWTHYTKADTARNWGSVTRRHTYLTSLVGLEQQGEATKLSKYYFSWVIHEQQQALPYP